MFLLPPPLPLSSFSFSSSFFLSFSFSSSFSSSSFFFSSPSPLSSLPSTSYSSPFSSSFSFFFPLLPSHHTSSSLGDYIHIFCFTHHLYFDDSQISAHILALPSLSKLIHTAGCWISSAETSIGTLNLTWFKLQILSSL